MQSSHQMKTIINVTGRSPTLLSVCRTSFRKGEHRGVLNSDHTTEYRCGHVGKHGLGETGGQCEVHAGGKKGMINAGQRAASTATHRSGGARELVPREERSGSYTIVIHENGYSLAFLAIFLMACRTPRSPRTSSAPARVTSKGECDGTWRYTHQHHP
jgi:hypothetical protein